MTVFVPITVADAQALRASGTADDLVGYTDGPGLRRWLGDSKVDDEEAGYVALNHAGVAALVLAGSSARLVLAVDQERPSEADLGTVTVAQVRWDDVRSLFADDPGAGESVAAARQAVQGMELAEALEVPAVAALQEGFDLLWYAPEELDQIAQRG